MALTAKTRGYVLIEGMKQSAIVSVLLPATLGIQRQAVLQKCRRLQIKGRFGLPPFFSLTTKIKCILMPSLGVIAIHLSVVFGIK